jgi:hypothetical protein
LDLGSVPAPVITEEYIAKRISLNIKGSVRFVRRAKSTDIGKVTRDVVVCDALISFETKAYNCVLGAASMYRYNFDAFIHSIKDLDYREMINAADREAASCRDKSLWSRQDSSYETGSWWTRVSASTWGLPVFAVPRQQT